MPRAKDHLVLADEPDGSGPWLTEAEQERERARADASQAELLELRSGQS